MGFSSRKMYPTDWDEVRHFRPSEFKNPEEMGYEFILWLDKVRERAAVPMTITSSYRSPEYNRLVGGAADSAHTDKPCEAVDIGMRPRPSDPNWNYSRFRIIFSAYELGCRRFGTYSNGSLHIDRSYSRPDERMWVVVSGHP